VIRNLIEALCTAAGEPLPFETLRELDEPTRGGAHV
jgi:hypothetical protein